MPHRPRHPTEIERRFCKPVEPLPHVEHRLASADQACLEEALGRTRAAHLQIHLASATLAELLEGQSLAGVRTATQQLRAAAAAASQALEALP